MEIFLGNTLFQKKKIFFNAFKFRIFHGSAPALASPLGVSITAPASNYSQTHTPRPRTTCRPRPRGVPGGVARPRPSPSNRAAPGPSPSNTQVSPGPINTGHLKINVYRVAGVVLDQDGWRGYVRFVAHCLGRGWFRVAVNSTGCEVRGT